MSDLPSVIGRYEVERLLGEGGMGVLYLARDPVIDRHVALKLLRVNGEDLRRRLVREAQSAGRLQHPNIVTVYDVGDHDGQLYIALEYIDGDTLATLIRDNVPFSAIRKLDIIDEIADGLGYAHQRGIIHRDIKPANLMISRAGLVKVLDFGIARLSHRETCEIDGPTLVGTPAYMAPEQLEGAEVDARSDIYAVGLVMYELFSGRRAFVGATTADVLQRVLASQLTPIDQLVPDLDEGLASVIAKAMARQPRDRYQDLQAMRKDLARARRRAMQSSADEATIIVSVPVTRPVTPPGQVPAPAPAAPARPAAAAATTPAPRTATPAPAPVPATAPATPPPRPSVPPPSPTATGATPATRGRAQEDAALAHFAKQRAAPPSDPISDETVFAPVASVAAPPSAPPASRPPAPGHTALPASAAPAIPPPPPLPPTPAPTRPASATQDDGPVPVPLPAVASTGMFAVQGAGRSTVDAAVIDAARRAVAPPVAAPVTSAPASPPRQVPVPRSVVAAAPPVAPQGAVQPLSTPIPDARRGLPTAAILVGVVVVLALLFLGAFVAVRSIGGLFTQTVEPRVAEPTDVAVATTDAATPPPTTQPTEETVATDQPASEATSVVPPVVEATVVENTPAADRPAAAVQATATTVSQPPAGQARQPVRQAVTETPVVARLPPARETPREQAVVEPPPPPVERRAPDPPPVLAPESEGLALVRAYVAARNTAHASGIRRVWPGVDDTHLRRVTSSFSAPLTLAACDVTARDAAHALAVCHLTQAGTTGTYAPGQGLTIRRTFQFDLVRQGRGWVIAGLRE